MYMNMNLVFSVKNFAIFLLSQHFFDVFLSVSHEHLLRHLWSIPFSERGIYNAKFWQFKDYNLGRNMKARQMDPLSPSYFLALTVCDIHFCI